jgi:hypothetical protein
MLCPHYFGGRPHITAKNRFMSIFSVGEQAEELFVTVARRRQKIADLLSSWQTADPIFLRSGQLSSSRGQPLSLFFDLLLWQATTFAGLLGSHIHF